MHFSANPIIFKKEELSNSWGTITMGTIMTDYITSVFLIHYAFDLSVPCAE